MAQPEAMEQKQHKSSKITENFILLKQIRIACTFELIQVFISSTVNLLIFVLQQLQMEELFEMENILAEQSQPNLSQLGQPWQVIHNQMQNALGDSSRINNTKNNPVSKKKLLTQQPPKDVSKIQHASILKQNKRGIVARNTVVKKHLKLDFEENKVMPSTISFTDRVSNPFDAEYFDCIDQIQQGSKELKESKDSYIAKMEISKTKSRSDNNQLANCKISEFLLKVPQNQRERTTRSSLLVFPSINSTNKRQLPSIYKKKKENKGKKYIKIRQQKNLNMINSQIKEKRINICENLPTQESHLECSKLQTLKCNKVICPHAVTTPSVENIKEAKQNEIPITVCQVASLLFSRTKSKSIHSLDSKNRRNTFKGINMRSKSLEKLKISNKKEQQYKFGKNGLKNVGKQISELKQMKYRLYLYPQNNLIR